MIKYHQTGTRLGPDFKPKRLFQATTDSLKCNVVNGAQLWPTKNQKFTCSYTGNLGEIEAGWYQFSLYNQLPGLPCEGNPSCGGVAGFSGHYSVKFNPETGEIMYRKFGDYGNLISFIEVDGDWEFPVNTFLCTYLRKICSHAWTGAFVMRYTDVTLEDDGKILYKSRNPVNLHTGCLYENCYYLLTESQYNAHPPGCITFAD